MNSSHRDPEALIQAAIAAFEAGDVIRADKLAAEVIALDPGDARAHHLRGAVALRDGRNAEAVDHLQRAIQLAPDYLAPYVDLVAAAIRAGHPANAVAAFERIAAIGPPPDTVVDYALAQQMLDRPAIAESALRATIAGVPDHVRARCALADLLGASGRREEARAAWSDAVALAPDMGIAHAKLGRVYFELGQLDDAIESLRRALALAPSDSALWTLVEALVRRDRVPEAEDVLWRVYELGARANPLATPASDHCLARGDRAGAIDRFRAARDTVTVDVGAPSRARAGAIAIDRVIIQSSPPNPLVDLAAIQSMVDVPVETGDFAAEQFLRPDPRGGRALLLFISGIALNQVDMLRHLRRARPDDYVAVWLFDNHHRFLWNYLVAAEADIAFPAHGYSVDYFAGAPAARKAVNLGPAMPLGVVQWTAAELAQLYGASAALPRSDQLHGRMSFYPVAAARNRLTNAVARAMPESDVRLTFDQAYHGLTPRERFLIWRRFKTSLHLPVLNDLAIRVFDALAAGHVPIVPAAVLNLDDVIPPEDQRSLPIIRFTDYTVDAVRDAHRRALAAFDAGGEAQAAVRHRYALERHMLAHRVRDMVGHVGIWLENNAPTSNG